MVERPLAALESGLSYLTSPKRYWKLPAVELSQDRAACATGGNRTAAAVAKKKDTKPSRIVKRGGFSQDAPRSLTTTYGRHLAYRFKSNHQTGRIKIKSRGE